jgi:hypothetical protein
MEVRNPAHYPTDDERRRLVMTTRARLRGLTLLLGASAIIGGATSGQAIARPIPDPPQGLSCPVGRVCLWEDEHFHGTKKVVRPVPSGQCRELGKFLGGWRSVYNASSVSIRVWQLAVQALVGPGPRCIGANYLVAPHTARGDLSFDFNHNGREHGVDGLGGR